MTVTAEAEVTRKIKALDVVPAIGMSGSMRRGAGQDGTGETIRFSDSADCIPDTPARWSPTVRKSLVFGTSYPVFNRGGIPLVRCPLWVISRRFAAPFRMSAFGGKADIATPVNEPMPQPADNRTRLLAGV